MQCCSNKRVTVYLSNLFLCPIYHTFLHFSSIFFFSTLKFDFFLELRTVKSSSCPFWRICFAAVCIENGLADLKTWMLQKSSWMTWWATHRSFMEQWGLSKREVSVDFWSCTISNVSRRWGWNRCFELLQGWGFTLNTALTLKDQKRRWQTSMVSWRSRCFSSLKLNIPKKDALENDLSFKSGYFMYVKSHLGNSFRVGPVKLMGLWNLWVVCRNLPSSNLCWKVASGKVKISTFFVTPNGPPFFWFQGFRRGVNFQELHSWRSHPPKKNKHLSLELPRTSFRFWMFVKTPISDVKIWFIIQLIFRRV